MSEARGLNDYDSEPVTYCARCYSLKVKHEDAGEFCENGPLVTARY